MKILVADTQGEEIGARYARLLPGVTLRGYNHPAHACAEPYHPHGAWCGWLAGVPLQAATQRDPDLQPELVFVQIFNSAGRPYDSGTEFLLEQIEAERPDVVSCSWGMWDGDHPLVHAMGQGIYEAFSRRLRELKAKLGFSVFYAAGNNDRNDYDPDIDYPQLSLADVVHIIGATDPGGIPARWSGDGPGLQCVLVGDRVLSPDMYGVWHVWRGTSSTAPKAAGLCCAQGFDDTAWRDFVRESATHPEGKTDLRPHPKWGWGNLEWAWQAEAASLPPRLLPPRNQRPETAMLKHLF